MTTPILMPSLSPGMTEGKLVQWLKKEGDFIKRGEVIAELETDKSLLDLEAAASGRLEKILVEAGEDPVEVDTPLALLATADPVSEHIAASPLAKRLAAESGIALQDLTGSGPGGRIVKADIGRAQGEQPAAAYTLVPHSSTRRIIAARLAEAASTIPHFYLTIDCRMNALLALRSQLNAGLPASDKLSVNDFIIRACALALRKVPQVNASWGDDAIRLHREVDIAVAVAAPDGLVTPIVRRADGKGVADIAAEMKQLAGRARERRLRPEEFQGGGFSISNLGMYGIREFTAIINPPHVAILAVGAAEARPVVQDGQIIAATVMSCTLSCDHRAVDGATGAEFLGSFRAFIENFHQLT
jgi:pyruvate dehydrogenase E2 component (dihydrolipoamide acetyltransferase)